MQQTSEPLQLPQTDPAPSVGTLSASTELMEALFRVLLHNDDVTPFDYVIGTLAKVFTLSSEISEHIALTAHHEGLAIVIIRPRTEAERLSQSANRLARADGFPLTFSVEPNI